MGRTDAEGLIGSSGQQPEQPDSATGPETAGVFRGWIIVAAGFGVLFVVYGLQFSFGEFRLAATEEEGWSQTALSAVFAVYIGLYSMLSAAAGWATDRFGPRPTVAVGSVILCVGWAGWALSPTLTMGAVALALIAPFGMSCSWVPVNATAVRWFVRRRGLATAVVTAGGATGNIVAPPIAAFLIGAIGWRSALLAMSGVGVVLLLAAASVLIRDPESVGLAPDGDPPSNTTTPAPEDVAGLTRPEAMRTPTFWLLWAMYSMTFVAVFVPFVHGTAYAVDLGVERLTAATVISAIGVGGLTGRLLVGSVSDRVDRRWAVRGALVLQVVGFSGLAAADGLSLLYPSAVAFGFGYGGAVAVFPALVGDYFGRRHAGAIVGVMFASAGTLAAVGPYVAALLFDAFGNYRAAFATAAVVNAVSLALSLRLIEPGVATGQLVGHGQHLGTHRLEVDADSHQAG